MIYSITKCPHCGKTERKTNPSQEIGMPFEICPNCKNIRINPYKEEWITKSPKKRSLFLFWKNILNKKATQDAIAESLKRTDSVFYLCALKKAGYTIYPLENTIDINDINDKLNDIILDDDNMNNIINNTIYDMALNESFKKHK